MLSQFLEEEPQIKQITWIPCWKGYVMHWPVFPPNSYVEALTPSAFQACLYLEVQFAEQLGHPQESRKDRQEKRVPGLSRPGRWMINTTLWCLFSGGSALLPALGFREGLCILLTSPLHSAWIEWICLPYKQGIAHLISLQGHALCCRCSMSEAQRHSWMYRIALFHCSFIHLTTVY